jgi:hypothetical protein
MLPINNEFNYSCVIGNNKKVEFRPWKTKDEKAFLTFSETVDDIDDEDFYRILVGPCMKEPDIYLSDEDIQMLLIEIRKASMGEDFTMKFICKKETCQTLNEIDVMFDNIVDYKRDSIDEFIDKDSELEVSFGDIKNVEFFKSKTKDATIVEKVFIELILRIEKIKYKGLEYKTFKYEEIYEYIDNLEVKVFDKLMEYYNNNKSKLNMEGSFKCMSCKTENAFIFDEIPNFLEGW